MQSGINTSSCPVACARRAALQLLRKQGYEAVNIKQLAQTLDCSTQPVYLSFSGMEELRSALTPLAAEEFERYMMAGSREGLVCLYGMRYLSFAREEPRLFRFLFMRPRAFSQLRQALLPMIERSVAALMETYRIGHEEADLLHDQLWMHAHGITANGINVIGNCAGVFLLRIGAAGVAWPSLLSRILSAALVTAYCFRKDCPVRYRAGDIFAWEGRLLKKVMGIALPNGVENGVHQLVKVALSSMVALFGTYQIAANGVAYPFAGPLGNGLRAAGDVRFTMLVSIALTIGARLFFSALFGRQLGLGVIGVAIGMSIDLVFRGAIFLWRLKSQKWTRFRLI